MYTPPNPTFPYIKLSLRGCSLPWLVNIMKNFLTKNRVTWTTTLGKLELSVELTKAPLQRYLKTQRFRKGDNFKNDWCKGAREFKNSAGQGTHSIYYIQAKITQSEKSENNPFKDYIKKNKKKKMHTFILYIKHLQSFKMIGSNVEEFSRTRYPLFLQLPCENGQVD